MKLWMRNCQALEEQKEEGGDEEVDYDHDLMDFIEELSVEDEDDDDDGEEEGEGGDSDDFETESSDGEKKEQEIRTHAAVESIVASVSGVESNDGEQSQVLAASIENEKDAIENVTEMKEELPVQVDKAGLNSKPYEEEREMISSSSLPTVGGISKDIRVNHDNEVESDDEKISTTTANSIAPENKTCKHELKLYRREVKFMRKILHDIWLGLPLQLNFINYTPSEELQALLRTQSESRSGGIALLERTCLSNEAAVWLQVRLFRNSKWLYYY